MMNNAQVGIIGYGEVGRAIAELCKDPKIRDLDRDDGLEGVEYLHVCIPYSDAFVDTVGAAISEIRPNLAIIHSTVAPGTTAKIQEATDVPVVHSPVRGIHPDLVAGIKTFIKFVGASDPEAGSLAKQHLSGDLGLDVRVWQPAESTEVAKLLSTTFYGLCIAWYAEMKKVCDEHGMQFDNIIDWTETYNNGYAKLGNKHFTRPVLYAPPKKGIGGHCVLENAIILAKLTSMSKGVLHWILSLGKDKSVIKGKAVDNEAWLWCEVFGRGRSAVAIAEGEKCDPKDIDSKLPDVPQDVDNSELYKNLEDYIERQRAALNELERLAGKK